MLECVRGGGHSRLGQARRLDAVGRGPAGMQRLGHRPEVGGQAGRQAGRDCQGMPRLLLVEAAQAGGRRGGCHGAEHAGGMPALGVMRVGLAADQLRPYLVADQVGADRGQARCADRFALGEHRRNQNGARMAGQRHVIVVERVSGHAIDERCLGRASALVTEQNARLREARALGAHMRAHEPRHRLVTAGKHGSDRVDETGADDADRLIRDPIESGTRCECGELTGESWHVTVSYRRTLRMHPSTTSTHSLSPCGRGLGRGVDSRHYRSPLSQSTIAPCMIA